VLHPHGFAVMQAGVVRRGAWDDVRDVTDRRPGRPQPARGRLVLVMADAQTWTLASDSSTPGGAALRRLVRFYWRHRDHRAELTTGAALVRLRDQAFDTG